MGVEEGEDGQEGLVFEGVEATADPLGAESQQSIAVGSAAIGVAGLEVVRAELPHHPYHLQQLISEVERSMLRMDGGQGLWAVGGRRGLQSRIKYQRQWHRFSGTTILSSKGQMGNDGVLGATCRSAYGLETRDSLVQEVSGGGSWVGGTKEEIQLGKVDGQ